MVSEIVGEVLVLSIMLSTVAAFAHASIVIPKVKCKLSVEANSGSFDVVMISGSVPYSDLKFIVYNSTTGEKVCTSYYENGSFVGKLHARVSGKTFSTGDLISFKGKLPKGVYDVIVVCENQVVFDGRLRIQ